MDTRPTVLEKPIGIRAEDICTEPTSLRLEQHNSRSSSGGYTISDATRDIFTVDKESSDWNSRRSFYDASGIRLFDLDYDSKVWSVVLPGQEDNPVGTFVRCSKGQEGDYIGIRFVDGTTDQESTLSVRAKFTVKKEEKCLTSKDVCVYYGDALVVQTKMIKRYMSRVPFRDNEWDVHVAQGFDKSLVSFSVGYPVLGRFMLIRSIGGCDCGLFRYNAVREAGDDQE
jgi:hypothetical protein